MECLEGNKLVYAIHSTQHPATDKGNIPMKKGLVGRYSEGVSSVLKLVTNGQINLQILFQGLRY